MAVRGDMEDSSPFRLSTTTRDQSVDRYSWKTKTSDSACGSTESTTSSAEPLTSLSTDSAMSMMSSTASNSNNGHSYSSLKSRIKAVQEKYRKSSVTKQIKNKFISKKKDQIGNNPGVGDVGVVGNNSNNNSAMMSKFRSHSHGALPSLDEFTKSVVPEEVDDLEDDINGIWSASQLAAKEKNIITQILRLEFISFFSHFKIIHSAPSKIMT